LLAALMMKLALLTILEFHRVYQKYQLLQLKLNVFTIATTPVLSASLKVVATVVQVAHTALET